jgi:hypothetical protein
VTPGDPPFRACPYSLEPDERGEVHPHDAGLWYWAGVRRCATCERRIRGALRSGPDEAAIRAEARRELARIAGREYWLEPGGSRP